MVCAVHRFHSCLIFYLARSTKMLACDPICAERVQSSLRDEHCYWIYLFKIPVLLLLENGM